MSWFAAATALCAALGCGGRARTDADPTPSASGGESSSVIDGTSGSAGGGESDGAGGLHSVVLACDICSLPELACSGALFPESQSTFRSNLTAHSCDYAPATGFDELQFHVDCKDGPTKATYQVGYSNRIIVSDGALHFVNSDGTDAFVCAAPSSVR